MSKIVLNGVRDVPLNKLHLSQANVRRIQAGVSIEELAEDIARRGLLQSLSVRPVLDNQGEETGAFTVPAGGRRFGALKLLVKQKRMSATVKVPCIVRVDGVAEEDSLAENTMREALHPLDQFRAFRALRDEHSMGDEEIAAKFFVTPAVVRQRLKLAAASPKLLDLYAAGELTLEQLMAFCVTSDHARQDQVWEALARSYSREPYAIRRLLTERAVPAGDKRAVFVGAAAYEAAGGAIARDLFQQDRGGWFEDPALLERLVREKLEREAEAVREEGWKWVEVAPDFPYGHTYTLRRIASTEIPISEADQAEYDRLRAEYDELEAEHAGTGEDLSEEVDSRLAELEAALARFEDRPPAYDPDEIGRAGAFVSLDHGGALLVERGYVRPEDEAPQAATTSGTGARETSSSDQTGDVRPPSPAPEPAPEEEDGIRPLPERLLTELTAHRTVAASRRARPRLRGCVPGRLARPGNESVVPVRLKLVPGDRGEERGLLRAGAGTRRTRPRRGQSRPGRGIGAIAYPTARTRSGTRSSPSTARADGPCSRIASGSPSMPSTSPGAAGPVGSRMPTNWRARSASTLPRPGRQPPRVISAG